MANRHTTLTSLFTDVANAIRSKTGSNSVIKADDFDTEIANIPTGGGSSATPKDINFYDYDGTLLHSWTLDELANKTELPELPTQEGLICQGWNWSLADLKTQNTKMNVGATYTTDDGKTRIYIHLEDGRTELKVGIGLNGTCVVDFGDGYSETINGTNINAAAYTSLHDYATAGDYVITLDVTGSASFLGSSSYSYLITGSITSIKAYSNSIRKIEIGNNITRTQGQPFNGCYSLSSISIPNSVTYLETYTFDSCYSISSLVIPNSITFINNRTFNGCYLLSNIAMPKGITGIGNSAFSNCYSLSSISIPNSVTYINNSAFSNCYSLSSLIIPKGVTSIGSSAFTGCYSLSDISISNGLNNIASYAFSTCRSLSSITIPSSVTSIGSSAFSQCVSIKYFDFTTFTSIPTLSDTSVFNSLPSDYEIRVPLALLDDWKAAANWSNVASHIVGV